MTPEWNEKNFKERGRDSEIEKSERTRGTEIDPSIRRAKFNVRRNAYAVQCIQCTMQSVHCRTKLRWRGSGISKPAGADITDVALHCICSGNMILRERASELAELRELVPQIGDQ